MKLRNIQSHNPNNTLLLDIHNQLNQFYLKMSIESIIVFVVVYICTFMIIMSIFVVIELILNPIENELNYFLKKNKLIKNEINKHDTTNINEEINEEKEEFQDKEQEEKDINKNEKID